VTSKEGKPAQNELRFQSDFIEKEGAISYNLHAMKNFWRGFQTALGTLAATGLISGLIFMMPPVRKWVADEIPKLCQERHLQAIFKTVRD
jgi:hypothetical protein